MKLSERATATKPDNCECCGRPIEHPRNAARHRAFFAMLQPAFANWPESHEFQPHDAEDLRGWLLCKAQWCEVDRIGIAGGNRHQIISALTAFMSKSRGKKSYFRQTNNGLAAYTPKSIAFAKCKEDDFRRIIDDVAGIIEAETGIAIADMKRTQAA